MNELEYRRLLKKLPERIEPSRDLWPSIQHRIDAGPGRQRRPAMFPFAIAASVLTAMVFGGWLMLATRPGVETPERVAVGSEPTWRAHEALALESEAAWRQFGDSEQTLMKRAGPQVYAAWIELDGAETELEAALASAPGSGFLIDRLKHVELEKLKLARIAANA